MIVNDMINRFMLEVIFNETYKAKRLITHTR